ncbi:hypothetical protein IA69_23340 [Massilia sp. JS1662]|nr:hypothetical protein IA69_23340 [Massilia sp. JS1662]
METDAALLIAAGLRGLHLHAMPGGLYALYRIDAGRIVPCAAWQDVDAVRALLGAEEDISLRAAAERDGLRWPDTPAAVLDALARRPVRAA